MATIVVGTNSWVTEAEANTYMTGRIKASLYWTNSAADNVPALISAYQWLTTKYDTPTTATQDIKNAQCEMALFLLQHQPDLDLRMGLQAQGVIQAGVVKERYRDSSYDDLPVPPIVQKLMAAYDTELPAYMVNLERNEEEGVGYDAYGNLLEDEE